MKSTTSMVLLALLSGAKASDQMLTLEQQALAQLFENQAGAATMKVASMPVTIKLHQISQEQQQQLYQQRKVLNTADESQDVQQLTQSVQGEQKQSSKLSDSIKNLSSEIPETKVLENKLDQMIKLEPKVNNALQKLNVITMMPSPQVVKATEQKTQSAMKQIDAATDGSKEIEKLDAAHTAQQKGKVATVVTEKEVVKDGKVKKVVVEESSGKEMEGESGAKEEGAQEEQNIKEVEKAIQKVKTSVDNKDQKATTLALKDTIAKADEFASKYPEAPNTVLSKAGEGAAQYAAKKAPNSVVASSNVVGTGQQFISKAANTTTAADAAGKQTKQQESQPQSSQPSTIEEDMQSPMEQERIRQTIQDSLENEGIWAKNAEMKKEIAQELLKQTKEMAKKPKVKVSKWESKEGLKQVKQVLTRETMKKLRQISSNKPGDAVSDVVSQIDKTGPNNFIAQPVKVGGDAQEEKPAQVKCKEGQDEVFDNCIKDESLSKEQIEEEETTVDQVHRNEQAGQLSAKEIGAAAMDFTAKTSGFKAESNTCECTEGENPCACDDDARPAEPEPMDKITKMIAKPPKKETKEEVQTKAVKQADKVVKKIQKKVGEVVKQVSVKKEEIPGGLIDLMSKAIATKAKTDEERADNRNRIETMVRTRIAASDSTQKTTRDALSAGFKSTRETDQTNNHEIKMEIAAQTAMKKQ